MVAEWPPFRDSLVWDLVQVFRDLLPRDLSETADGQADLLLLVLLREREPCLPRDALLLCSGVPCIGLCIFTSLGFDCWW